MHTASISIPCENPAQARILHDAIAVEADEGPPGTTTLLALQGEIMEISLTGADLSGLRAALHSVLRLLDAARRTLRPSADKD